MRSSIFSVQCIGSTCVGICEWKCLIAINVYRYNDDANGILKMYSRDPRALDEGKTVMVEEREQFALELIVERTGMCVETLLVYSFV